MEKDPEKLTLREALLMLAMALVLAAISGGWMVSRCVRMAETGGVGVGVGVERAVPDEKGR